MKTTAAKKELDSKIDSVVANLILAVMQENLIGTPIHLNSAIEPLTDCLIEKQIIAIPKYHCKRQGIKGRRQARSLLRRYAFSFARYYYLANKNLLLKMEK